ncbi:hypothetical protein [Mycoplana sp. MJR14]|uniref:hypothetical protein n=1 Tax=Mycoplana sp. MJR14 TaxID=3032583 RepID=UPI0023DACF31|nr:hypothetical protein [Mycoplana sp. MJR14]MDF1633646.1 hypothetical protein [Mycoplana sp. MJR14]
MTLGRLWAGRAFGTNTGNLFVQLEGDDNHLAGTLRLNDQDVGLTVYRVTGTFDGQELLLNGLPETKREGVSFGVLAAKAVLDAKGSMSGQWSTDIGAAGTFVLHPHDQADQSAEANPGAVPDQLYTARASFGAVQVDRADLTALADDLQREFSSAVVVVTILTDSEVSRFLPDFKKMAFKTDTAILMKLYVQQPEPSGLNRIAQIEFGPQANSAFTQGGDEAWVLGMREKIRSAVRPLERTYATNFKNFGVGGLNQLFILGAVVTLPSLSNLSDRAIFMVGVLVIVWALNWVHMHYLPLSALYLGKKQSGFFGRIFPSAISWLTAVSAGVATTLLAAYLQGWAGL